MESGYAVVTTFEDRQAAREAAASLVGEGIGAAASVDGDVHEVRVLDHDLVRACEILGVELPEQDDAPPRNPWKYIIGIWLVAMVVIPLLAYWITVSLAAD